MVLLLLFNAGQRHGLHPAGDLAQLVCIVGLGHGVPRLSSTAPWSGLSEARAQIKAAASTVVVQSIDSLLCAARSGRQRSPASLQRSSQWWWGARRSETALRVFQTDGQAGSAVLELLLGQVVSTRLR